MIAKLWHVCIKMTQSEWWVIDYEESGLLDYLYSIVFSNINNYDEFIFIHLLIFFYETLNCIHLIMVGFAS